MISILRLPVFFSLLLSAAVLSLFLPPAGHARESCGDIDSMGDYWYRTTGRLDKYFSGGSGLTQSEADRIDSAIGDVWPSTWELAEWLSGQATLQAAELGNQLLANLNAFDNTDDWSVALDEMNHVVVTIAAIFSECEAGWPGAMSANGAVSVTFQSPTGYEELAQALIESNVFQQVANGINAMLALPVDLPVNFTTCDTPNAFYDPETQQVTMCYELLTLAATFADTGEATEEEMGLAILGTGTFFMLHEVGHALVHVLELPVTGREEDSVDSLATLILMSGDETDEAAVFAALQNFWALANLVEAEKSELPFWDEHSLNSQRLYDVACLVYGSDPEKYSNMVGSDGLPEQRAVRCPREFEQKNQAWGRLLEPHYREG